MSISPRDGRNAQNKSRSYSPSIPTERFSNRAAHRDSYMNRPVKEPYGPSLSGAAYRGNYLESNHEYPAYGAIDGSTRKNISCFEELGYAAAPTVDPYSLQSRGPDDSFYTTKVSEEWNPDSSERYRANDMPMQGYLTRLGGQVGAPNLQVSRTPITTDSQTHPRMLGGTSTDDYLQPRYSLGSSGARSSQPSSGSFGLSGASAPRGSVMDKYAYGLSGPSGPQSSVMDRYAPSLDGTVNTRTKSFPQQSHLEDLMPLATGGLIYD